jgi:hypothetical protein
VHQKPTVSMLAHVLSCHAVQKWAAARYATLSTLPRHVLDETFLRRHELAMALVSQASQYGPPELPGRQAPALPSRFAVRPLEVLPGWVTRLCEELPALRKRHRPLVRMVGGKPVLLMPQARSKEDVADIGCVVTRRIGFAQGMSYSQYVAAVGLQLLLASGAGRKARRRMTLPQRKAGAADNDGKTSEHAEESRGSRGIPQSSRALKSLSKPMLVEHMLAMEVRIAFCHCLEGPRSESVHRRMAAYVTRGVFCAAA